MNSHDSALTHVTGKSEYVDDRPLVSRELFVSVVLSQRPHAEFTLDFKAALKVPGVVAIFTAKDLAHNLWGGIFPDQPLLADELTLYNGEPIALIAGETKEAIAEARALFKVRYRELKPILSIKEAREHKSFIGSERKIERGDCEKALRESEHTVSGTLTIKGADHFYLESQAAIAYPLERGVEVHSSSQHPTEVQHVVAHALGLDYKDVTCIVKRMGGAFGGKETQGAPFAAYVALVAHKTKRAARLSISLDDDMITTGKRNPFEIEYQVGFDSKGLLTALEANLFSDAGAYADLSTAIMERAMLHCDNAYYIPHMRVIGRVCKTHFHSHTAFRGFGGPKGVALIEMVIEKVAHKLGLDSLDVRRKNVYREGYDVTHYGQKIPNNMLPKLFSELEKTSEYVKRRLEVRSHNLRGGSTRRGLSMTAVKFGISFTTRFLNQGNALVMLERDGTIKVSTGATEMGQGVNARIAKIVADEFGVTVNEVRVLPTSTDRNSNTSPTAASSGTDLNGTAALMAATKIKERLSQLAEFVLQQPREKWADKVAGLGTNAEFTPPPGEARGIQFTLGKVYDERGRSLTLAELANEAYLHRISLSEYAHYKVKDLSFNKLTGQGDAFFYFTQGVAVSEVSVDCLSGEVKVLRSDILMDLGRPINEGLDRGQITGGFVQGMGWLTTEHLFYSPEGRLLSHSPSTYKIPNIQDIPRDFRVALIANDGNSKNVRATKAVGEPPLLLAISIWTAVQDALKGDSFANLGIPATSEQVLRALNPEAFHRW